MTDDDELAARAAATARALLVRSMHDASPAERRAAARLGRLVADDAGRGLLLHLTDHVVRIRDPRRSVEALRHLVARGLPASMGAVDRVGLRLLALAAPLAARPVRRLVDWRVGRDTSAVIVDLADPGFSGYLRRRAAEGFAVNVNVLGEAILGDAEAEERCRTLLALIRRRDVTYVSVKTSAVCANLDVLAEADSLTAIAQRLRQLYRAGRSAGPATFVNLDMEEYRDLDLSLHAFMAVLDEPEFADLSAGIVLQAYLPDSHDALRRLCEWATARHARGGAAVKVRLVKGANLGMERVEAEQHGWQAAIYPTKADVDASFKALLDRAMPAVQARALRVGVASHNLFDIAWALTLREQAGVADRIEIEMLEGMAPPQARAVRDAAGGLLLYAPAVSRRERDASTAYLSRRLDENSGPENFLRAMFGITPDSPAWDEQQQRFRRSVALRHHISTASRRAQDRAAPVPDLPTDGSFANAPDTDFTVAANRRWIAAHLAEPPPPPPPLVASQERVDELVARALVAQHAWAAQSWAHRRRVLGSIATVMEQQRGRALAVMAHATGKTVREGDPEVSEAVDFTRYAAHLTLDHERHEAAGADWQPHRLVVVAGPWNFPYAIPACGVVHAVAAGAAVVLKPAPEAREVGALLVEQVLAAGAPADLVQLACTPDDEVGRSLITRPEAGLVMLTGSAETAATFLSWRPAMALSAETSGKNAIVITAAADLDQAIRDLVRSAFGHAGQKCSAASLAIVEASVYDDPAFAARVADAVRSLPVGRATELRSVVGPLIGSPAGKLRRALTTLDAGESWLVEPRQLAGDCWSPGVRRDVRPGSWFHLTECFGPVLGLMRALDLDHAIELQNATEYGLTGGIQSLDAAEIEHWLARVEVGNAYVNRHITGAVVRRQPFGGWKGSSIGPGSKPGGPHHLASYGTWTTPPAAAAVAAASYEAAWRSRLGRGIDASGLASEGNVLRYVPLRQVIARVGRSGDAPVALLREAARVSGVRLDVSSVAEPEADLLDRLPVAAGDVRLRLLAPASDALLSAAHARGVTVDRAPVTAIGELELPHWLKEQAISRTLHRHGLLPGTAGQ